MALSAGLARCRFAVPLCAFFATAALGVLLAAQAELACSRQVVMAMPGMAMPPAGGVIALCPIVLALGLAAAIFTAAAATALVLDPFRHGLARRYARFSFPLASGLVLALGTGSVGLMIAVDGSTPAGVAGWLLLAGIVVAATFATTLAAFTLVRALAALGGRIVLRLARELGVRRRGALVPIFVARPRVTATAHRVPPLATRRGLRAPPLSVR